MVDILSDEQAIFVDKRINLNWLRSSRLKGVSEGFICAAQDQQKITLGTFYMKALVKSVDLSSECADFSSFVEQL